jgi:hypothetical protein
MVTRPKSDWPAWCRGESTLSVSDDTISVTLPDGRGHSVVVDETADAMMLTARVASRSALDRSGTPEIDLWVRNRAIQLVGFRLDRYDAIVGEAWLPRVGLTQEEFLFHVRTLASECDRLEVLLTGLDVE